MNARAQAHRQWMNWLAALLALFVISGAEAYNKSWDQGHQVVYVEAEGGWGYYDYEGEWQPLECCGEGACTACPVHVKAGRLHESFTDLTVQGIGPELTLKRVYNSQYRATSFLGNGWTFNFGKRLIIARRKDGAKIVGVVLDGGERNYYTEDAAGRLQRLTKYGATFELAKNSSGTYTIQDRSGRRTELLEDGRIARIFDRNGNALTFQYSSTGCISRVTSASGSYIDFEQGPNGKIASATDSFGRTIAYGYDENGNLISVTDPLGNTVRYEYDSHPFLTKRIDARGNTIETVTYDNNQPPRVASFTEKGETYSITYFADRTEKSDSQGNKWTYYFNDVGVIERTVDPLGNEIKRGVNKVTASSVDWEDDANGNRTNFLYDQWGNVVSRTDPFGNTTSFSYVAGTNWVATETSPTGIGTTYQYDGAGNVVALKREGPGSLSQQTDYKYDARGNLLSLTDATGAKTQYEYDGLGNLKQETDPLGNVTSYEYDLYGNLVAVTDSLGNRTGTSFDAMGRRTAERDALGNERTFEYDADGHLVAHTDRNGNRREFAYDAYGRLVTIVGPGGGTIATEYVSPRRIKRTDQCGRVVYVDRDLYDRVVKVIYKVGDTAYPEDGNDAVTTYTYDAVGNMLTERDSLGGTTQYQHDVLGRVLKVTDAVGQEVAYSYDADGRLTASQDALGNVVTNTYVWSRQARRNLRLAWQDCGLWLRCHWAFDVH